MIFFLRPNIEKLKSRGRVKDLIKALSYKDYSVHEEAIKALVEIGSNSIIPLTLVLGDSREMVRNAAIQALGEIGVVAIEPLITILNNLANVNLNDYKFRKRPIIVLRPLIIFGRFGQLPRGLPILTTEDSKELVHNAIVEVFVRIGQISLESLIGVIKNYSNQYVCDTVAEALKAITKQNFNADASIWEKWWHEKSAKIFGDSY